MIREYKNIFQTLIIMGFVQLLASCEQEKPVTETESERQETTESDRSDAKVKLVNLKSAPIDLGRANTITTEFSEQYREKNGRTIDSLRIKLDSLTESFFKSYAQGNGIVLQYGMTYNDRKVGYLVGLGNQNSAGSFFTNEPFPSSYNNVGFAHYILLDGEGSTGYSIVSVDSLKPMRDRYRTNIERKYGNTWRVVKSDGDHPRMVFHQTPELIKFFQAYQGKNPTHFYVLNGMVRRNGWFSDRYHQPFLKFGDATKPFDLVENPSSPINEYDGQALDAGHVCPPHCNIDDYSRDDI